MSIFLDDEAGIRVASQKSKIKMNHTRLEPNTVDDVNVDVDVGANLHTYYIANVENIFKDCVKIKVVRNGSLKFI